LGIRPISGDIKHFNNKITHLQNHNKEFPEAGVVLVMLLALLSAAEHSNRYGTKADEFQILNQIRQI
jgi:hypothetical protein